MGKIKAGFIVDIGTFKLFVKEELGSAYDQAEKVFLAFKEKEAILSYSVAIVLIRAKELGKIKEVFEALERAVSQLVLYNGDYRKSPNEHLIDEIVDQFKLI